MGGNILGAVESGGTDLYRWTVHFNLLFIEDPVTSQCVRFPLR